MHSEFIEKGVRRGIPKAIAESECPITPSSFHSFYFNYLLTYSLACHNAKKKTRKGSTCKKRVALG
jgi:hypothetical protein